MSEGVEMKDMTTPENKVEEQGVAVDMVVENSQPKEEPTVENDVEKASSVEKEPSEEKKRNQIGVNVFVKDGLLMLLVVWH